MVVSMRRIMMWTEAEVTGLARAWGLSRIVTEVDEQGMVTRELGYDADGNLVHRHPGEPTRAKYGVFDLAKIAPSEAAVMEPVEFDRLWSA
jgi:YD repeat-containing protein